MPTCGHLSAIVIIQGKLGAYKSQCKGKAATNRVTSALRAGTIRRFLVKLGI